jgi:hypothetical protein
MSAFIAASDSGPQSAYVWIWPGAGMVRRVGQAAPAVVGRSPTYEFDGWIWPIAASIKR